MIHFSEKKKKKKRIFVNKISIKVYLETNDNQFLAKYREIKLLEACYSTQLLPFYLATCISLAYSEASLICVFMRYLSFYD